MDRIIYYIVYASPSRSIIVTEFIYARCSIFFRITLSSCFGWKLSEKKNAVISSRDQVKNSVIRHQSWCRRVNDRAWVIESVYIVNILVFVHAYAAIALTMTTTTSRARETIYYYVYKNQWKRKAEYVPIQCVYIYIYMRSIRVRGQLQSYRADKINSCERKTGRRQSF